MSVRPVRVAGHDPDAGFTLLEVVIAISLITIVMTGMLSVFIGGVQSSSDRAWRASAVQLANEQMELVRAVPVASGAGLVQGRDQTGAQSQWTRAASASYPGVPSQLSRMNVAYQATPVAPASERNLPFTRTAQVGTNTYEINTFVGTCNATRTGGCTKAASTGSVVMFQVVVQVSWNRGHGQVGDYVVNTLIDPSSDQTYNTTNS